MIIKREIPTTTMEKKMILQFQIKNLKTGEIDLVHNFVVNDDLTEEESKMVFQSELDKAQKELLKNYDVTFCNETSEDFIKETKNV